MKKHLSTGNLSRNALYAFDCCSESLDHNIGFRAIIIITKGQSPNCPLLMAPVTSRDRRSFEYLSSSATVDYCKIEIEIVFFIKQCSMKIFVLLLMLFQYIIIKQDQS